MVDMGWRTRVADEHDRGGTGVEKHDENDLNAATCAGEHGIVETGGDEEQDDAGGMAKQDFKDDQPHVMDAEDKNRADHS